MTTPTLKIKITPAPKLRGKMDVRFPANVEALSPIVLDKSGGTFTFSLDANALSAVQSVVAGSNVTVDNTDPRNPVVSASASGTGDFSSNTSSSVDGEIVLFSGTGGKTGKRATGSGLAKLTSGVLSSATAGTDYYNPGGTDVAIADGGTGQSTATAGFNALAPTTTRGDVIVRGATNNQRLALGTSGYFLGSDGTDAVWQGFLQSGSGATTRTWQTKTRERLSVKDFGAVGDGVTNDEPAISLAETARAAIGGVLLFPAGTYLCNSSVSVNRANGGGWIGEGAVVLKAGANNVIFCNLTGAVISSSTRGFRFTGFTIDGAGFTGVRGLHEVSPYNTIVDHCTFINVAYCMSVIGPNSTAQTGWIFISEIQQYGQGSWAFYGYDNTRYIFHIVIQGVHQKGTGSTNWENDFWFEGRRAVGLSMSNVWSGSLDGDAVGLRLRGDCQGVFVNNTTFVWPTIGIEALTWTDTLKPAYVYLTNIGVDQHTVSGAEIEGRTWFITNANFANGYARTNTGQACLIQSTSTDIALTNCLFAYDQKSGLVVETGATKIKVNGITAENNNQAAGSNYDVDLQASTYSNVVLYGRNIIGSAGVNATGQRVVNGVTSKEVSRNTGSGATTAVTTIEDLMTYTIPANTLKPGQRVRLLAWGKTAANANTKTMRMYFGATSMGGLAGNYNNLDWRVETNIYITGSNTQEYERQGVANAGNNSANGTMTETDTSAITVKITGQNGTASAGDITAQGFTVEIID